MDDFDGPMVRPTRKNAEVAVIGSGPGGLSCAYFLALMQRSAVVFEAEPIPGGMLALGIPEFRLPKQVLQKEIDFILSHGVELRVKSRVEDARKLINQGFKAIFVATGAQLGKSIDIEGIGLAGVTDSLQFLRDRALGKGMDCRGKTIVVLGGGNAAVDVARSAVRLGARKVTILYRRTREEMPAYEEEIEGAINEGIELVTLGIPKCIIGSNGKVASVQFIRAELGKAEADGRRRPMPIKGSETSIDCDIVIPAIGQIPSTKAVLFVSGPELTDWGTIKVDPVSLNTTVSHIFAGGDCVTGPSSVINAIAAGQKAAVSIDKLLGGSGRLPHHTGFSFVKPDGEALAQSPPRPRENTIPLKQ